MLGGGRPGHTEGLTLLGFSEGLRQWKANCVSCCSWLPSFVQSVLALYPAAPERFHDLGMGLRGISFPDSFRLLFKVVHVAFGGSYFE